MKHITRTLLGSVAAIALAGAAAAKPLVSPVELLDMLGESKVVAIDVREKPKEGPTAYSQGHVPGSIEAPMNAGGWQVKKGEVPGMLPDPADAEKFFRSLGIDRGEQVVLIYDGSKPLGFNVAHATRAYLTLKAMGHDKVSILDGGYEGWIGAGLPVSRTASAAPAPGNFAAGKSRAWIATVADVTDAITSDVVLVDARPPKYFKGEGKHPAAKRAGTVPTAVNVDTNTLLNGGTFKDAAGIAATFAAAGVSPTDTVITFCNTGFLCSLDWFAASQIAGFPKVGAYDGSMTEWSQDESRPMVAGGTASATN